MLDIILLTVITLVVTYGFYRIIKMNNLGLVSRSIIGFLLLCVSLGALFFGYQKHTDRPQVVYELGGINLGMSPLDVTLKLGKPNKEKEENGKLRYTYSEASTNYSIIFEKQQAKYVVKMICSSDLDNELFGLSINDQEEKVINKLGEPDNISINDSGLEKFISYDEWRVSFGFEKELVNRICITETGGVKYNKEYVSEKGF